MKYETKQDPSLVTKLLVERRLKFFEKKHLKIFVVFFRIPADLFFAESSPRKL